MNIFRDSEGKIDRVYKFIAIAFIGTLAVAFFFIWREMNNITEKVAIVNDTKTEVVQDNTDYDLSTAGWESYTHPVLGLEFKYKEEWGEPVTSRIKSITDLATVNEGLSSNNAYYNKIHISFKNLGPSISIYNDDYTGRLYPNSRAYAYGSVDNFAVLKQTQDICDYTINFSNNQSNTGTIVEKYSECGSNVKTILTEDEKFFATRGTVYQFDLTHYGYKKLQNGYFDNLVVLSQVGVTDQLDHNNVNYDNFIEFDLVNQEKISREEYLEEKEDFVKFVNSIKTFEPVEMEVPLNLILDSDPNYVATLKKYYNHILSGELDQAYAMYLDKHVDFQEYAEQYSSAILATPRDFEQVSANTYKFFVDYQDENDEPQVYRIVMYVARGNINLISSERFTSDYVTFGDMRAFTKTAGDENFIVLEKNGIELVVDRAYVYGPENIELGEFLNFRNPQFSPKGSYLVYQSVGWEWTFGTIYDIEKGEKILDRLASLNNNGFTQDENYFFGCALSHLGGDQYINIYTVPTFEIVSDIDNFDVPENVFLESIKCDLSDQGYLDISYSGMRDWSDKDSHFENIYKYHFDTETLEKIK